MFGPGDRQAARAVEPELTIMRVVTIAALGALSSACAAHSQVTTEEVDNSLSHYTDWSLPATEAVLVNNAGEQIGRATAVSATGDGVLLEVEIAAGGLTPGWHGLHFHQVADCSDTESFTNSRGHVGMAPGAHGLLNADGPEAGDLPNIWAHDDGSAHLQAYSTLLSYAATDDGEALIDADGSALIIHAHQDDHYTQPIGGAGARVACAAFPPAQDEGTAE